MDVYSCTTLYYAMHSFDNHSILPDLIADAKKRGMTGKEKFSVVMDATSYKRYKDTSVIRSLLDAGASPNGATDITMPMNSPLCTAIYQNRPE